MYGYSKHAIYQMRERSITKAEIEACLKAHDTQYSDKKGNPIYRVELETGRGIKVVVAQDNPHFIITVADY